MTKIERQRVFLALAELKGWTEEADQIRTIIAELQDQERADQIRYMQQRQIHRRPWCLPDLSQRN